MRLEPERHHSMVVVSTVGMGGKGYTVYKGAPGAGTGARTGARTGAGTGARARTGTGAQPHAPQETHCWTRHVGRTITPTNLQPTEHRDV